MIHTSRCMQCKNLDLEVNENNNLTCATFPYGIPDDALFGKFNAPCAGNAHFIDLDGNPHDDAHVFTPTMPNS